MSQSFALKSLNRNKGIGHVLLIFLLIYGLLFSCSIIMSNRTGKEVEHGQFKFYFKIFLI